MDINSAGHFHVFETVLCFHQFGKNVTEEINSIFGSDMVSPFSFIYVRRCFTCKLKVTKQILNTNFIHKLQENGTTTRLHLLQNGKRSLARFIVWSA